MKKVFSLIISLVFVGMLNAQHQNMPVADSTQYSGEKHFKNIQQLTVGGDNAEAYFSFDGKYIIFQRTNPKDGVE